MQTDGAFGIGFSPEVLQRVQRLLLVEGLGLEIDHGGDLEQKDVAAGGEGREEKMGKEK